MSAILMKYKLTSEKSQVWLGKLVFFMEYPGKDIDFSPEILKFFTPRMEFKYIHYGLK
jgi:hypothetical protein